MGKQLVRDEMFLVIASLVQKFDIQMFHESLEADTDPLGTLPPPFQIMVKLRENSELSLLSDQ